MLFKIVRHRSDANLFSLSVSVVETLYCFNTALYMKLVAKQFPGREQLLLLLRSHFISFFALDPVFFERMCT